MQEPANASWIAAVRKILDDLRLKPGPERPCPYLGDGSDTGLQAREVGFFAEALPPGFYHAMMDLGFRRSGKLLYLPQCRTCAECRQIRAPVSEFHPHRSQRRVLKRNRDLIVTVAPPTPDRERFALYKRYLELRHDDGQMSHEYEAFIAFLYESCVDSLEVSFRLNGRLAMVGIVDREPQALSAVYCYYDPDLEARSPGLYNMLWSLEYCRTEAIPWYYMGYYIAGCRKMNYKTRIQPCELLQPDGSWQRHTPPPEAV